ncbi:MAG: TonB-dependent receptor, partial [Methylococcales bacterium]|nr:TonB-dependent receptor [Methylococcales bacterium]
MQIIIRIIIIASALMPTLSNATLEEELNWLQAESIVFSASRTEQQVLDTAAAVFVLNQQEIKRSGVTSVPEALRLVPGLQVAKVNANLWAISSRGFNNVAANKLLVMIDGRTVYHPVFSGTLWRTKDVMLEDVERIEVIRGSGAAMWGSNAVNGVINVITKKAEDTQGVLVTAGGGTEEQAFTSLRYGGNLNGNIDYRAYFKYSKHDEMKAISVADGNDDWENFQGGFRIDSELTDKDQVTLQGDIYRGDSGRFQQTAAPIAPTNVAANIGENFSGGNVLGKWTHSISATSGYSLQLYFDQTVDKTSFSSINDAIKTIVRTYDIDFQNHFQLFSWQNVTWGLGVRHI